MNKKLKMDIELKIQSLKELMKDYDEKISSFNGDWAKGYYEGCIHSCNSEIDFLHSLLNKI